jgi:glycosyltransferase involved in cell wall biosynthesis
MQRDRPVRQSLSHRLAITTKSCRPWPDRPVAVALVITDLDVGGAERSLAMLATRLDPTRWRPAIFCLGGPGQLVEVIRQADIPCECLEVNRRNPLQAFARLAHRLRRFKPQLVQSFMFHANLAARVAAPWAGWPWVIGGLRVAERQKRWHLIVDRLTAPLVTGSVCVSQGVLRFSHEVTGLDLARLTVIPNGIDPRPFDTAVAVPRAGIGIPDNVHLALYVGRLDPQKGLPDLLGAAERVIAQRPEWHLALVGDGPSRPWLLEQLADHPRLREKTHWLGRRDDVPGLLKTADVLVLASLWEGMPNVVLEAMAARLPVIGTAVEGTEDLVLPGRTGWLVPPRDPEALTRALIEAVDSPELCRQYGEEGRRRVEQEFSLETTLMAYERLWAGVLGLQLPSIEASWTGLGESRGQGDPAH